VHIPVVRDVLRNNAPEAPMPDRNQPVQTFFFDRSHEPFRVCVRIRRTLEDENHKWRSTEASKQYANLVR
jgi:hypothetical protein